MNFMSGRLEREQYFERKTLDRLKTAPPLLTDYYYNLVSANKSYATVYSYINHILSFLNYTFNNYIPNDFYLTIKPSHINKYIASLRTKNVNGHTERTSDSIRAAAWSILNSLFHFLTPVYIKDNPMEYTTRPKMKDTPKVTYLTPDEIERVLSNVSEKADKKVRNRDACLLKLGFSTGLRSSAILQIDVNDIDFDNNQIRVTEKGGYEYYVMFGFNLRLQLLAWLHDREVYFNCENTNALFVSSQGNRLCSRMLSVIIQKYTEDVVDKHVTPHVMRHSCATNLYEKTGDIYLCAKQLNHKTVATTQRYAEISRAKQQMATNILDDLI